MADGPRVGLIHALVHSIAPVNDELARAWPEAVRMNLLDDSLSADVARGAALDERMTARFVALAGYAFGTGADGILFTCSAFGPCIEAVARLWPDRPVLKPNEAMIDDAVALARAGRGRIALCATFAPTLASMPAEFPRDVDVVPILAEGALDALGRGDGATHDRLVAEAVAKAAPDVDTVALAQFSLARAAPAVARVARAPVLTTPASAVRALRARLAR
jgi:hypothetical protein